MPVLDRLAIFGNHDGKRRRIRQHLVELARCVRRNVQHHQDGGIQVGGQGRKEAPQRLDPAGRRPDDHDVAFGKGEFSIG